MGTVSELAILSAKSKALDAANQSIGKADAALVDGYRSIVSVIDEERVALVDETTGRLRQGTLAALATLAPNADKSWISTAWSAFRADPEKFAQATSLRQLRDIASSGAAAKASASEAAKALKALSAALAKASAAGVKPATIIEIVEAAIVMPDDDDDAPHAAASAAADAADARARAAADE